MRERYRELVMEPDFSLTRRLLVVFGSTLGLIGLCLLAIRELELRELWIVPFMLVAGSVGEHVAHRWAMHRPVRGLERIFKEHRVHHRNFTHDAMHVMSDADYAMILSSGPLLAYFIGFFVLLPALVPLWLWGRNVACLFVALGIAYFAAFELFHMLAHMPAEHRLARAFPLSSWFRRRHRAHHDPRAQLELNFNVVLPLADQLLGTTARARAKRASTGEVP
jgi:sterol desaturase/sphingolipid hydroxylase (fatty acid hydroxylase superfamily)